MDDASKSSVLPSDRDKELIDEAARGSVAPDGASAHAALSTTDQAQPTPAFDPEQTDEPLNLPKVHARLPLDRDSMTFAVVGLESSDEPSVGTETIAAAVANTETIAANGANTEMLAATDADTETAAETEPNTETAAETDANTFDAKNVKPKRRSRKRRRGSPAGVGGAALAAVVTNSETIAETETIARTDTNARVIFEYSGEIPIEKQLQNQLVISGASASHEHRALRQRGPGRDLVLLPTPPAADLKWPIVERIITLCILIVAVASVIVLLVDYEKSVRDNAPSPSVSLPQAAAPLTSNLAAPLDDDEIARLIRRGKDFLKGDDFRSARRLFKRAADAGSAEAARALGSTFDPATIKQLGAVSVAPDIDSALQWYTIAADRGSAEAADQYANLLRPSQTTGTVTAVVSDEPTSKPAEVAPAQDRAPPASTPRTGPQARPSQVLGAQGPRVPVPAKVARAQLSTAPTSEPKLPPSSAESTQVVVGQDRQRLASEVASPPALKASASSGSQRPPLQEQLNPDEITALLRRGNVFLKTGDFSAARILLKRGAESGSADAALMLGKTFDPLFLREIGAIGIKPDVVQCRRWYQRALELGSGAAAQLLANLAQTGQ